MKKLLLLLFYILCCLPAFAQIGGRQTFSFLNTPANARVAALGGINITSETKDASIFLANPALVHEDNHRRLAINYFSYPSGIGQTNLTYAWHSPKWGRWGAGLQYMNYGNFDGYDINGNSTGTFSARDYAFIVSHSRQVEYFSLGVNVKFVGSAIGSYRSGGVLFDMGGAFIHPKKDLRIGLMIKNVGFAFSNYTDASQFVMPFDVQAGVSFKPEKMPVRLSLTAHHLYRFNIAYNDPDKPGTIDAEGNEIKTKISFADKLSRHFVIGTELVLHRNFNLRFGYNFLQRRELSIEGKRALAGFSFGGMLSVKSLEFSLARNIQHLAGGTTCFALVINTKSLFTKKKVVN